jgi:FkbM family methyltransferase
MANGMKMIKRLLVSLYLKFSYLTNKIAYQIIFLLIIGIYHIPHLRKGVLDAKNQLIKHKVKTIHGEIVFTIVNWHTFRRVNSFFSKEPGTLIWIDDLINEKEVLFDVGANIGLYSLYAAARGASVYAFEPDSQNFSLLYKNIWSNSSGNRIKAYNIAISDSELFGDLHVAVCDEGSSLSNFGSSTQYIEQHENLSQGVYATTIDDFSRKTGIVPNHIKIDVDGLEPLVLKGAHKTLMSNSFKSLQVEVNLPSDDAKRLFLELEEIYGLVEYKPNKIADSQFKNSRDENNKRFIKKNLLY